MEHSNLELPEGFNSKEIAKQQAFQYSLFELKYFVRVMIL